MLNFWNMWMVWFPWTSILGGVLDYRGAFDLFFLFIMEIWYDVQNGSGFVLSSISCQTFAVSPPSSDLVDLCPILWFNNPKETLFFEIFLCGFFVLFCFYQKYMIFLWCTVISPRSVWYHWRKLCKILHEKGRYVLN